MSTQPFADVAPRETESALIQPLLIILAVIAIVGSLVITTSISGGESAAVPAAAPAVAVPEVTGSSVAVDPASSQPDLGIAAADEQEVTLGGGIAAGTAAP